VVEGVAMELWRPDRCNCQIWARVMKRRYGGQLVKRPSFAGWWKHMFWTPDGKTLYDYSPVSEYELCRRLPPLLYRGKVRKVLSETLIQTVIIDGILVDCQVEVMPDLMGKGGDEL